MTGNYDPDQEVFTVITTNWKDNPTAPFRYHTSRGCASLYGHIPVERWLLKELVDRVDPDISFCSTCERRTPRGLSYA